MGDHAGRRGRHAFEARSSRQWWEWAGDRGSFGASLPLFPIPACLFARGSLLIGLAVLPARILRFEEIEPQHPVGGKAAGLARLLALGLPVPRGFVILDATPGDLPADLAARYAELGGGAVAVRSSAIGEDSAEASFAGQYETILDVVGEAALVRAIEQCLASLHGARAEAYVHHQHAAGATPTATRPGDSTPPAGSASSSTCPDAARRASAPASAPPAMCVVVQCMAPAVAAGVLFTADPVRGRRARPVIDAVRGLGEALVSGHASPDHYVLDRSGRTRAVELAGEAPVLAPELRARLLADALRAEAAAGHPLDLEWAVGADDSLYWLQARPITQLPRDPCELDTPGLDPEHVLTRCNVGEMFPGACTPLSYSFTARAIDVGMQRMHQRVGIQAEIRPENRFIAMSHGQLFLNLSTMSDTATQALGSSAEMMAQSVCGRSLDEIDLKANPAPPLLRQIANGLRYGRYLFSRGRARAAMKTLCRTLEIPCVDDPAAMWRGIEARFVAIDDAMDHHLVSSAVSGVLTPTLLGVIAKGTTPTQAHHAEVAALLAFADGVESADIVAGAERIQRAVLAQPDGRPAFVHAAPEAALAWIQSDAAGAAREEFAGYLARHGHRAVKELELRQPEWRADPLPLIRSIQVPLRQGAQGTVRGQGGGADASAAARTSATGAVASKQGFAIRWLTRLAREAVRSREETKSGLVHVTTIFKEAYRHLGRRLVATGALPDADAVFFLTQQELGRLCVGGESALAAVAGARREIFSSQEQFVFPDVLVGEPEPLDPRAEAAQAGGAVTGAPVSRGRAVGRARVIRSLAEAERLERGEILVAPITDVGWTPYFSLIAGLVTDVGSAVSHGAVVAREYGLPAVVNTRTATRVFRTGDWIVLDGERGIVRLAEAADRADRADRSES